MNFDATQGDQQFFNNQQQYPNFKNFNDSIQTPMTNQSGISNIDFMMPPDINKYEHEMGK